MAGVAPRWRGHATTFDPELRHGALGRLDFPGKGVDQVLLLCHWLLVRWHASHMHLVL